MSLFTEHLEGNSLPEIITSYSNALWATSEINKIEHASKLLEYRDFITNSTFLSSIRKHFNSFYNLISENFPDIRFRIDGRRKSYLSVEKKIMKLISENRSLDNLRDLFAFRIIIWGDTEENLVNYCYEISNTIGIFFIEKGFILCDSQISETEKFNSKDHPDIYVPHDSMISLPFQNKVKDYIHSPKENSYQSIHLVFYDRKSSKYFEVQVRTFLMHRNAENGKANWQNYKDNKYDFGIEDFNPSHVKLPGFGICDNGDIIDFDGFMKAFIIHHRSKTF